MPLRQEVVRFAVVGVAATALHFGVLTLLVEAATLPPPVANGAAFLAALCVTYLGQSLWVFRARSRHGPRQMLRFALSLALGLGANVAIMALSVDVLGLSYRGGFVLAVLLVPALSFVVNRFWVFAAA